VRKEWLSTLLLAILLGALVFLSAQEVFILERIRAQRVVFMEAGELSSSWVSGGATKTVTTTRLSGEAVADWQKRHFDAVKARMEQYPPD
jgi:hypothetical protein